MTGNIDLLHITGDDRDAAASGSQGYNLDQTITPSCNGDDDDAASQGNISPIISQSARSKYRQAQRRIGVKNRFSKYTSSQQRNTSDSSKSRSRSPISKRTTSTVSNSHRKLRSSYTEVQEDESSSDDNEMSDNIERTPKRPGRKKTSIMWNHFDYKSPYSYCRHCNREFCLKGSTSTGLSHLRSKHEDKLTEAEKVQLHKKRPIIINYLMHLMIIYLKG